MMGGAGVKAAWELLPPPVSPGHIPQVADVHTARMATSRAPDTSASMLASPSRPLWDALQGERYIYYRSMATNGGSTVARIEGIDPDRAQGPIKAVFEAQTKKWGAPLSNHLLYARRPTIFRGARAMWSGLD